MVLFCDLNKSEIGHSVPSPAALLRHLETSFGFWAVGLWSEWRLATSLGVGGVGSLRLRPLFVPSTAVYPSRPSRLFWVTRSTRVPTCLLSLSLKFLLAI